MPLRDPLINDTGEPDDVVFQRQMNQVSDVLEGVLGAGCRVTGGTVEPASIVYRFYAPLGYTITPRIRARMKSVVGDGALVGWSQTRACFVIVQPRTRVVVLHMEVKDGTHQAAA